MKASMGHSAGEKRMPFLVDGESVFADPVVEAAMLDEALGAFVVTTAKGLKIASVPEQRLVAVMRRDVIDVGHDLCAAK
jgi:hypothetical protein